jgi:ribosomal protein S18 acetylase RimI-like enzyme
LAIKQIHDRNQLHSFLSKDPVGCAYQLGDLDEAYFPWCNWWGGFDDRGVLEHVFLLYRGLSIPVALTCGLSESLGSFLPDLIESLPERFYCQIWEDHFEQMKAHYDISSLQAVQRMSVKKETFKARKRDKSVVRLGHRDTVQIMELYQHYPDNFFEPYQVESGLYFGIRSDDGAQLVSIGGIHVLSEVYDVAAIGNLVTHPDHRCQGYASRVISHLLNELFQRVSLVALNVQVDNIAAIKTCERFNFEPTHRFFEGIVTRS